MDKNKIKPIEQENAIVTLYGAQGMSKAGTEEMTQEDRKIPYLILLQNGTDIPELGQNRKIGWYYRTDTKDQMEEVEVNLIYVTNEEKMDKKQEKMKHYKAYFGFYADSIEPFKLRMSGWGMAAHKDLQTEITMYQQRLNIPMFALTVKLTSEDKKGTTAKGEPYNVKKIVCTIVKDPLDPKKPLIETNPERVAFLYEAISHFKSAAPLDDTVEMPDDYQG